MIQTMTKYFMGTFILGLFLTPSSSNASTASSPRPHCVSMEAVSDSHHKWKSDFKNFADDYEDLRDDLRHRTAVSSLRKVLNNIRAMKALAGISGYDKTITDADRILKEAKTGPLSQSEVARALKLNLIRLQKAMDSVVHQAQEKQRDCEIENSTRADAGREESEDLATNVSSIIE